MKAFVTVVLFSALLVAFTEANFYGKRGESYLFSLVVPQRLPADVTFREST